VLESARKEKGVGMYSETPVENRLKGLIIAQMKELYDADVSADQLLLTVGGIGALYSSLMCFLEKGDRAVYFDPSYPLHISQVYLTQAKPIFVPYSEKKGWAMSLDRLERKITKRTRAIILTNPNNPTGTVLSEEEVRRLARIVLDNNLMLILDEAYEFLTYGKRLFSPMRLPELRDNIVLCKSFSKEYAMTGWRIGYAYANKEVISKLRDVHTYFSISPPTISIYAAIAALSDERGKQAMEYFREQFRQSRETICRRLDRLPKLFSYVKPEGAYYVFPKIKGFKLSSLEFAKLLVDEARVITIPGSSMGPSGEGHLRMSFAAESAHIERAFDRIDEFAKKHNLM
jgi:aminotransferase